MHDYFFKKSFMTLFLRHFLAAAFLMCSCVAALPKQL